MCEHTNKKLPVHTLVTKWTEVLVPDNSFSLHCNLARLLFSNSTLSKKIVVWPTFFLFFFFPFFSITRTKKVRVSLVLFDALKIKHGLYDRYENGKV